MAHPLEDRRALARTLRADAQNLAEAVTDEFLGRHPDWVERYGAAARVQGIEDARFHLDFLIGALIGGDPASFARYAVWTAGVLGSRGITAEFLVENLEQIRDHVARRVGADAGLGISRLVDAAVEALARGPDALRAADEANPAERALYLQAALAGDRRAALNITLEALRAGSTVTDIYQDILQPAQYEIGRLWERNVITVAREHAATAVTQYVIARLYEHFPPAEENRGNALITGVRGELHQVGANMVADVLEADGWNVRFLGTQLPHRDILDAVAEHEPRLVGISAAIVANMEAVADLISALRERFDSDMRIIVGGAAFRFEASVWRELGADGHGRDLRDARELARRLAHE